MSESEGSEKPEPETVPEDSGLAAMFPPTADTHLTEPLQTPPVGPPLAPTGSAEPPAGAEGPIQTDTTTSQQWVPQAAFDKERRKSRIFLGTTVVAAALLAGALFYAVAQGEQSAVPIAGQGSGQGSGPTEDRGFDRRGPGQDQSQGDRGPGPRGGPGGLLDRFFDSDGSLDEDAIAELQKRLEDFGGSGFTEQLSRGLEAAVASGAITQEQADQLLAALGGSATGADA